MKEEELEKVARETARQICGKIPMSFGFNVQDFESIILSALKQVTKEEGESCPNCPDQGWYVVANRSTGEPEQVQCQWCHETKHSKFNVANAQNVVTDKPSQPAVPNIDTQRLDQLEKQATYNRGGWIINFEYQGRHSLRSAIDEKLGVPPPASTPTNPPEDGRAFAEGETVSVGPREGEKQQGIRHKVVGETNIDTHARSAAQEWLSGPARTFTTRREAANALAAIISKHLAFGNRTVAVGPCPREEEREITRKGN